MKNLAQMLLIRYKFTTTATLGRLYINGEFICYTLEDAYRGEIKIPKHTCIQCGTYYVELTHSTKFNKILPIVIGVVNFTGIRFHSLNNHKQTDGCIGPGLIVNEKKLEICRSSDAEEILVKELSKYKTIILTIINEGNK